MISIILPAYNAEKTIGEAIQRIIDQTYKDWELLIINDGSIDGTKTVIQSYHDPRIKYFENEGNKKLIYTLNRGLELATGEYIARMDADDVALPERLEKQVRFMDMHPDVVASGCGMYEFIEARTIRTVPCEVNPKRIKVLLFNTSPIYHPTAIIRNSVVQDNNIRYDSSALHVEDYMLWYTLSKYGSLSNINENLLNYRLSETQVSNKYSKEQLNNKNVVRKLIIKDFLSSLQIHWNEDVSIINFIKVIEDKKGCLILDGVVKKQFEEVLFIFCMSTKKTFGALKCYFSLMIKGYRFSFKQQLIYLLTFFRLSKRWTSYSLNC